jgi:bacterioferritin
MSKEPPETKGCETPSIYKCAYPAPYPEVRVAGPNPKYAQLLLEDYAGMVSEMTAVTQYSYHHFVLEDENREAADLLSCIALVEMHHLEILAETILLLGVDPRYRTIERNNAERYWDATFVFYGTALCDRLTAFGFVKKHIGVLPGKCYPFSIHKYLVLKRINLDAQFRNFTINPNSAPLDQILTAAARPYTCPGHHLLQTL